MQAFLVILSIITVSHATVFTKLRLQKSALDRLACPVITDIIKPQLEKGAVISWTSVSDRSVSKIDMGLQPLNAECRYELLADATIRFYLNWPFTGLAEIRLETLLDLNWARDSVRVTCNSRTLRNESIDFRYAQISMDICKEYKRYFAKTPSTLVYQIQKLALQYAVKSIDFASDHIDTIFLTSVQDVGVSDPKFNDFPSQDQSKMGRMVIDQDMINMIFEAIYANFSDQTYRIRNQGDLAAFIKSIASLDIQNINIAVKFNNPPNLEMTNGQAVIRMDGTLKIDTDQPVISANYRLKSRLKLNTTVDNRISAVTSINDIALMISDFEFHANRSLSISDQRVITQLLSPIIVNVVNDEMAGGLPLPLPRNLTMVEPMVNIGDGLLIIDFDVVY